MWKITLFLAGVAVGIILTIIDIPETLKEAGIVVSEDGVRNA